LGSIVTVKNEATIQEKISQSFLDNIHALEEHSEVLLALSGGLDSSVLLHLLKQTQGKFNFNLKAIHIHHGLNPLADNWLNFCNKKCKSLDINFYSEKVKINLDSPLGIEGEARKLRYEAIKKRQKGIVVLGHHQNDQAETLLLQLLRGSGLKGLAAMPEFDSKRNFWRPLLNIKRDDLAVYAKKNNIQYIEDASNQDMQFDRNFLRQKVLPLIESRYPASIETISRSARNIAEGHNLNNLIAIDDSKRIMPADGTYLSMYGLKKLPKLRAINLIRWWLSENNILMPNKKNIEELYRQIQHIKKDASLKLKISNDESVRVYGDKLFIVKLMINTNVCNLEWSGQEELNLPNKTRLQFIKTKGEGLSLSKLGLKTLKIQSRIGGEKFKPFSDQPTRSLKYLFQNANIPPWERNQIPLIFAKKQLVAVPNLGIHYEFQAKEGEMGYQINWLR